MTGYVHRKVPPDSPHVAPPGTRTRAMKDLTNTFGMNRCISSQRRYNRTVGYSCRLFTRYDFLCQLELNETQCNIGYQRSSKLCYQGIRYKENIANRSTNNTRDSTPIRLLPLCHRFFRVTRSGTFPKPTCMPSMQRYPQSRWHNHSRTDCLVERGCQRHRHSQNQLHFPPR